MQSWLHIVVSDFFLTLKYLFSFYQLPRCLTIDDTHLQIEIVEPAIQTDTETEDEDIDTEGHLLTPLVVTEIVTEGDEGTDKKEAIYAQGGMSCIVETVFNMFCCKRGVRR